ncbi:leucine-rich repeat neuronal protein 2-like [Aricia agestis]|uniref:leucine-rich repeat neuronal protein 2-like n=1 Tax=Aricia agestis TaxID=91739 RepID=UPI001C205474|nr:leucine-rich repeat neuronal protein 2-like [Aricia agestis]
MLWIVILAFMAYSNKVESVNVCDSSSCVCNVKTDMDFSETVVCSYDNRVLDKDYTLPISVYSLDLSRNNLTKVVPTELLKSNSLTELILSKNRINIMQGNSFQLPELRRLDLSDNNLLTLDVFKNINKLEYLNIANNKFTTFENIKFHNLAQLKEIVLDSNNLGPSLENNNLFDRNEYGLTNEIASLSISGINLNKVHENFFVDAYNLRKLVISNNNIKDVFELPFTLEYLDLSDNPIEELSSEDFNDLVALKVLKLNNLWIKEIKEYTFANLPALTSLELERNFNLTGFSEMAFGQRVLDDADDFALERLSLKSSRLHTLDEKLLVPFGQLLHLDLQGNFWRCDCHLVWIKQLQIPARDYAHARCFTPKTFFNGRIFDIDAKYFVCGIKNKHIGFTIAAVTCLLSLTAIAFCIFTVPKYTTRLNYYGNIQLPTAEYTVLPAMVSIRDDD